ncbi:MAG TPA: hypothetical protein PK331_13845 [Gordonia sp. (in: high G+C Gram-positive bacteria)]|uniref:septum site-determining protein Ssd n=1 Tax=unclassified Gordonia (in: high G+C Gram-positive bacteria) TaxID=2657482 RepID=UPI000FB42BBC|nr:MULTISPECIES: septum site-determining protein Ssd [unclassified Gordonia (in: high G+C Gram-positive bacteria)]RUP35928.1 MAG: hypothetical protein EKK60_16430 [Gordonia sp. (in: high G+C Gram-positive bacteria)]HNP55929.1 hypothetical protein [Gordonia sp. (in: high G+C Gram-positive bacteria)]HRC51988.1 hypothetical protein [Gordonia sp. (in: high G+C Gram-positive bacteria)]
MDELLVLVGADLVDDVGRCAVAAGYRGVVGTGAGDVVAWQRASAVVVDVETVGALVDPEIVRRHSVFLVCGPDESADLWREAFELGVRDVIALPHDEGRLVAALTDLRAPVRDGGRVVAVLGGHGGAGATTLAAAVGLAATHGVSGRGVLLVGPDEVGAGIDLMLGIEDVPGPRTCDLNAVGGRLNHATLREALPRVGQRLSVLAAGERAAPSRVESVAAAVDSGRFGGDIVVVDVPRTNPALRTELLRRADFTVLVSQATLSAVAATRATRADIDDVVGHIELVLRGPAPGGLPADEIAWAVGVALLGAYRSDPSLTARMEGGSLRPTRRSPLGKIAESVCRRLDEVVR